MTTRAVIKRARRLRKAENAPENCAWAALRTLRAQGFPVRRQFPIGPYVVDFAIVRARLAMEIDGSIHHRDDIRVQDELREMDLRMFGWDVMRLSAEEAMSADHLLARVCAYLDL